MATHKRPLISTTSPASTPGPSSPSSTSQTPNPEPPSSSTPALPKFLTHPYPVLLRKFRQINAHEATVRAVPNSILNHHLAIARNRYPEVHPWNHNRIHLSSLPFPYINASPIDLGRENEQFIATQGPLERIRSALTPVRAGGGAGVATDAGETADDGAGSGFAHFWEMVWQEQVEVIVMLTRCVEEGKEKCGVYYPDAPSDSLALVDDEGEDWGNVTCESLREENGTEIRELRVLKRKSVTGAEEEEGREEEEEGRKVWHFLFLAWPDQEVPQTPEDQAALLELIEMTRFRINTVIDSQPAPQSSSASPSASENATYKPRIVHCSAGVGRTGTFIALDYLLQELDEGKYDSMAVDAEEDPVFEAVKRLREQRMFMVYKPGQYAFIYQVLRERWLERMLRKGEEDQGSPTKKRKLKFLSEGEVGVEEEDS